MSAREFVWIVKESALGTLMTSPTAGTDSIYIRLVDGNSFSGNFSVASYGADGKQTGHVDYVAAADAQVPIIEIKDPRSGTLVVGKFLSPKLYVQYGIGLFTRASTLKVSYILSRKWTVRAETGAGIK